MRRLPSHALLVVLAAVLAGPASATRAKDAKPVPGGVLAIDQVPDAPRLALQQAAQNHPIPLVIRRYAKGQWTYETTVDIGTTPFFLKVDGSGKLLERRQVDTKPARTSKTRRPSPRPSP